MNTADILLNIDLAAGTTALVALGMGVVPNIDRIRTFRRVVIRRPARRVQERRWSMAGFHDS
jgi:hypothetical protein